MVIYLEYLLLENFITGGLLLLLTAKLAGDKPGIMRLLAGSAISGAGGLTIFIPLSGFLSVILRTGLTALICAAVFGLKPKRLVKRTLLFLALNFLSGGAAMAFTLWQQIPAVTGNGALYTQPLTYGILLAAAIPAFAVTYFFVRLVREKRMENITRGRVCLNIKGKVYSFEALVDSGNSLKEPFTGRSAALIDCKGAAKLPFDPEEAMSGDDDELKSRFVLLPFKAVGTEEGVLKGIRTDSITFGNREIKGTVLAFYEGDFGDFEVLLSREVLDEGIT